MTHGVARFFVLVSVALACGLSAHAQGQFVRTIEDRDRVTVMEFGGIYDRQPESNRAYELAVRKAIAQEFFRTHADDYDFLVTFTRFNFELGSDEDGTDVGGRYYRIKNDVQGIGQERFDVSSEYGSNGRLQGLIDMGVLSRLGTDPTDPRFEHTLSILAHEFLHRWGASARFRDADGTTSEALLGRDKRHWSFLLQSYNSVLYGNDWRDNGNGTFTSTGRSRSFFSPLDLYLMGVLDKSQVPPFFLIDSADAPPPRPSEVGVTVSGTARAITIDEVIAAEGERVPPAASAPKRFKMAFLLLLRPGEQAEGLELRQINVIREAFATRALILTGGNVDVQIFPDAPAPSPLPPPTPTLPPSSGPRPGPVDLVQSVDWLLSRQRADGGWGDSTPTDARDTAAVLGLLAEIRSAFLAYQQGVAWLAARQDAPNVDVVSRRMAAIAPQYSATDDAFLRGAQNADGGWGLRRGLTSDAFDTALALAALPAGTAPAGLQFLIAAQNADGGWSMRPRGPSSIQATLAVLRLAGRDQSSTFTGALERAFAWLQTRQHADGGFGDAGERTIYDTADVALYVVRTAFPKTDLARALDYLKAAQLADGSWNESVYQTALAVRALETAELPNVSVSGARIAAVPASPIEGQPVAIAAYVSNDGVQDLSNVVVRVYDGDPASGGSPIGSDIVIPSLPGLTEVPFSVSWDTRSKAGGHTIAVAADPDNAIVEFDETDNSGMHSIVVRPAPVESDLLVAPSDVSFSPPLLQSVPQAQALSVTVANAGQTAATSVEVWVYDGNPTAGGVKVSEAVVDVAGRSTSAATFDFTIATPGEHRFFVVLDPANQIVEADEGNNQASIALPAQSTLDFFVAPGGIGMSQNPAGLGTDLTISASIGNRGTTGAFSVPVRVFIDDPQNVIDVATRTIDLSAGEVRPISVVWRTSRPLAGVPVVVQVDAANVFPESNENDNRASEPLTVTASTLANIHVSHQEVQVASPVLQGGSAAISAVVRNNGFSEAADIRVEVYVGVPGNGGTLIGVPQTITSLAADAAAQVTTTWSPIDIFGARLIYVVVDGANAVEEFDEDDNSAFVTVAVQSLPDLSVSSGAISFTPAFPKAGDPIALSALVSNTGDQPAVGAVVRYFDGNPAAGGVQIGPDQVIAELAGHAQTTVHVVIPGAQNDAVKTIYVQVDPLNQIVELDENDNAASRTIGVQDGSLFFSNLFFSPNGDDIRDTTELFYRMSSGDGPARAAISNSRGDDVRSFTFPGPPALDGSLTWDGRDDRGRVVPDGSYQVSLFGAGGDSIASARGVVDNNNSSVTTAIGTKYELQGNLTCGLDSAIGAGIVISWQTAGWLQDDSGLVAWYPTQAYCTQTGGFGCTNYAFTDSLAGVYVISPDGQETRRITPDSWTVHPPAGNGTHLLKVLPSPDGSKIAIVLLRYRIDSTAFSQTLTFIRPSELWVVNSDGSGLRQIATANVGLLRWSDDGEKIAFGIEGSDASRATVYVANTDGSGQWNFHWTDPAAGGLNNQSFGELAWSPDKTRVLFSGVYLIGGQYLSRIYAINPDGTGRTLLGSSLRTDLQTLTDLLWLGPDRFAKIVSGQLNGGTFDFGNARRLWLFSTAGGVPTPLTPDAERVSRAVLSPDRRTIAYADRFEGFALPRNLSTGIWLVDAAAAREQIYTPTEDNQGIDALQWSADGRRLAFLETVVTEYRLCFGEVQFFCGESYKAAGRVDVETRDAQLFPIASAEANVIVTPYGLYPEGNAFVFLHDDRTAGDANRVTTVRAVNLDEGTVASILDKHAPFISNVAFSRSGKYLLFDSNLEANGPGTPCWKNVFVADRWVMTSLLNLTTLMRIERDESQLVIRVTAEDLNFARYRLEYAPVATPDDWTAITESDTPLIHGVAARWIPTAEGSFYLRLSAEDQAGNTRSIRKRLTWGLTPSITNVAIAPRLFSPNGDGTRDSITIDYFVLGPVHLTFTIDDSGGAPVRTFTQDHATLGPASVAWDGRNDGGQFVADGVYRIHVLDFSFFVTADTTPPDVGAQMESGLHLLQEAIHCVDIQGVPTCSRIEGPLVDAPYHLLSGHVDDGNLASWKLDAADAAAPAEWLFVDRGTGVLLVQNADGTPKVPVEDVTVRRLTNAADVVDMRYRLSATDQAGNTASAVADFAPEEVILYAWDREPVPTVRTLERSLGPHTLSVVQTLRAARSLALQFRLAGTTLWIDGPAIRAPAPSLEFAWDNSLLAGGKTYEVRLVATDLDGRAVASNVVSIHSDLFEMRSLDNTRGAATGVASLREPMSRITLVLQLDDAQEIGVATFTSAVDFAAGFSPCQLAIRGLQTGAARFKGIGQSGRVYYSNAMKLVPGCPTDDGAGGSGSGRIVLDIRTLSAANCGEPSPQKVRIALNGSGIISGSQTLAIQKVPGGAFEEVPNVGLPLELLLDTQNRPEGKYFVKATGTFRQTIITDQGAEEIEQQAADLQSFIVDRTPPAAQITYPAANQQICPVKDGSRFGVTIEGAATDPNFERYDVQWGSGDDPAQWFPLGSIAGDHAATGGRHGILATWDVTDRPAGTYTLRLRAFDRGGNITCHQVTFTLAESVRLQEVSVDRRLLSPNGDGNFDSVSASFALSRSASIDAVVYLAVDGEPGPAPVRTIVAGAPHAGGPNSFLWDGRGDSGAVVPDGDYIVVVSARDACNNVVEGSIAVTIDNAPPHATILVPQAGDSPGVVVDVVGSVDDSHFKRFTLAAGAGSAPVEWTALSSGGTPVTDGLLGKWSNQGLAGPYTIRLTAEDHAGNMRQVLLPLTVPDDRTLVATLSVEPLVFSPNGDAALDVAAVRYGITNDATVKLEIVDGAGAVVRVLAESAALASGSYDFRWDGAGQSGTPAGDGDYYVRLTATAAADATHVQVERTIVKVDRMAPAFAVESPAEGAHVTGAVAVRGSVADSNLASYVVAYGAATGGVAPLDEGQQSRTSYEFGALQGLADGGYRVEFSASDVAGNASARSVSFTIDNTPPAVSLILPAQDAIVGGLTPNASVRGSIADAHLQEWTLRYGSGIDPPEWTTMATAAAAVPPTDLLATWNVAGLPDGAYTLSLVALDRAGSSTEARVAVTVDNTPPLAAIHTPIEGARIATAGTIVGDAADAHLKSSVLEVSQGDPATAFRFVELARFTSPVTSGSIHTWTALPPDGRYTLRLTVEDDGGLRSVAMRSVVIDTQPPRAPSSLTAVVESRKNARLEWAASPDADVAGYHVYRNSVKLTASAIAATTYLDENLADGTFTYTVSAVDAADLESARSNDASIAIDLTPPAVTILAPANTSRVSGFVDIRGTAFSADDFKEYRVLVGVGAEPGLTVVRRSPVAVVADVLAQYETGATPSGSLTIRLEAEDLSGNVASAQSVVEIDNVPPAAPVLVFVTAATADVTVTWNANTEPDLAGYLLHDADLLANVRRIVNGSLTPYILASTTFLDRGVVDGVHKYYVYAIDRAGNQSAASNIISIEIDTGAPRATIVRPADGTKTDKAIELVATSAAQDVEHVQFEFKADAAAVWAPLGNPIASALPQVTWDPVGLGLAYGRYNFRASATDVHGNTDAAPPSVALVYQDLAAPGAPSGLTATVSGNRVALSWSGVSAGDLAGYIVDRADVPGGPRQRLFTTPLAATTYEDANLADARYAYIVVAIDAFENESQPSNEAIGHVYQPTLVVPAACLATTMTALAGAGADPDTDVTLIRLSADGEAAVATVHSSDGTFQFDAVPLSDGSNTFTVRATDAAGNVSRTSAAVTVTFNAAPPAPADLVASVTGFDVALSWSASARAVAYNVYRDGISLNAVTDATGTGFPAASSNYFNAFPPFNAVDGNVNTYWIPHYTDPSPSWHLQFAQPQPVHQIVLQWFTANLIATEFELQGWTGTVWQTLEAVHANSQATNIITLAAPFRTPAVRVLITATKSSFPFAYLAEARVFTKELLTATTFFDANVSNGRHTYGVAGVNSCGIEGPRSDVDAAVGDVTPPSVPANLAASVAGSDVTLQWEGVADTDLAGYHVYRKIEGGDWIRLTSAPTSFVGFLDANVPNGSSLYRVTSIDQLGNESAPSNEAAALLNVVPPAAPLALAVAAPGAGSALDLSWTPDGAGSTPAAYDVLRATAAGGPYTQVNVAPVAATTYRDAPLTNGTTYFYVVRAMDAAGNAGASSGEASNIPRDRLAPAAPVIGYPTDAVNAKTIASIATPIAGYAEPGSAVTLLSADGLPIADASANTVATSDEFQLAADPLGAAFLPRESLLAVVSGPTGQRQLVLTDAVTRAAQTFPVAAAAGTPAIAPDGQRIALITGTTVTIVSRATGAVLQAVTLPLAPSTIAFSPDGTRLAATLANGVFRVDLASSVATRLTTDTSAAFAVWSPSGSTIAYVRNSSALRLIDAPTGTFITVDASAAFEPATFSADGTRVAYSAIRSGVRNVWTYDTTIGVSAEVPRDAAVQSRTLPEFATRGHVLAYFEQRQGAWTLRVHDLTTGDVLSIADAIVTPRRPVWGADGTLVRTDRTRVIRYRLPGHFQVDAVALDPGVNVFTATAADESGNVSERALPLSLTRDTSSLPDLLVSDSGFLAYPLYPAPGEPVRLTAAVRNAGSTTATAIDVVIYEIVGSDRLAAIGPVQTIPSLAPGAEAAVAVEWRAPSDSGTRRFAAVADPANAIREASESNNAGERRVIVSASGGPVVSVRLDRSSYTDSALVQPIVEVATPLAPADFELAVVIKDAQGARVATLLHQPLPSFGYARRTFALEWQVAGIVGGGYRVEAILARDDGAQFVGAETFTVLADPNATVRVVTDRASYVTGETVVVSGVVRNTSTNLDLADVTALTQVFDALGVERYRSESAVPLIPIGDQVRISSAFVPAAAGTYGIRVSARYAGGELGAATTNVIVGGKSNVLGQVSATPSLVPLGGSFSVAARITNTGTLDVPGQLLKLTLVDASSATIVATLERVIDLPVNVDVPWSATIDAGGLALGRYTLLLQASTAGADRTLASASLEVIDATAPAVAVTSPASGAAYNSDVPLVATVADLGAGTGRVEYRIDEGPWTQMAIVDLASGRFAASYPATSATEGQRTLTVRAVDTAGNDDRTSTSDPNPSSTTFVVDVTPPAMTFAGVTDGATYTRSVTPLVVVTDATDTTVQITLNGSLFHSGTEIAATGTYALTATATDRAANVSTATVHFVVQTNQPPVPVSSTLQTPEDTPAAILLSASDPENDTLVYTVTPPSNGGLTGPAPNLTYTPNADFFGSDVLTFTVSDGVNPPVPAQVSIAVAPVNDRPVARTGPGQTVAEGTLTTLDGSASSDVEGDPLTFAWTQIAGPAVTLDVTDPEHPTFMAPVVPVAGATLTFTLVVTDGLLASAPAFVNISVKNVNRPPVADAGPDQRVKEASPVQLNGDASYDPDGESIAYAWTQTAGPSVQIADSGSSRPSFVAPIVGVDGAALTFQLTVSDGLATSTDAVTIVVDDENHAPIADAGADQVKSSGALVTLDGSGSTDPDADPLTYRWSQVAGVPVVLSDSTDRTPAFTAPPVASGSVTLVFQLVVNDGQADSAADDVTVRVVSAGEPPVCTAARPSVAVLWPPNHQLVPIQIVGVSDPDGAPPAIAIVRVTQDEATDALGDGDTGPDAIVQGASVLIRAERSGRGNGRVINIHFTATDGRGDSCSGFVVVGVPLSQQPGEAIVDDGQHYDATKK